MAYRTGFETTNLEGKCGSCKHYTPLTKFSDTMGFNVEYCRGKCSVSKGCDYRSRTDGCKKWEGI